MSAQTVGVKAEEVEGILEVENFHLSYIDASHPYNPHAISLSTNTIKSGPMLKVGEHEFCIVVAWSLDARLMVTPHSMLGAAVERIGNGKPPTVELSLQLLNQDPSLSKSIKFCPRPLKKGMGTWPHPYASRREDMDGLASLADVLKPSAGFLHDGTLKVQCKIRVGISQNTCCTSAASTGTAFSGLGSQLKGFRDSARHTDVQLKLGPEVLHAHRLVLAAQSPVFDAMWSHPMREKEQQAVVIHDLEHAAVRAMIDFIYTDKLDAELGNDDAAAEIMKAAHKYQVDKLVELCVEALSSNLTIELAIKNLILADFLGHELLKRRCVEYITSSSDRMADIQELDAFKNLSHHLLVEIIAAAFPAVKRRRHE